MIGGVGACAGTTYVTGFTVLQENVSDELRGRTFATLYTVVRLCLLISLTISPLWADFWDWVTEEPVHRPDRHPSVRTRYALPGVRIALWGGGLITLVAGLVAWRSIRKAERTAAASRVRRYRRSTGPIEPIRPLGLVEPSPIAEPIEPDDSRSRRAGASRRRAARGRSRAVTPRSLRGVRGWRRQREEHAGRGAWRAGCARRGIAVRETFEPGAGATGAVIRELLLHGPESIEPTAEALLMAADRAQHVAAEIEPALARGEWVVCDRYVPSSLVYQGVVRGLGVDLVEQLNAVATQGLEPDLVIVFDVTDDVAAARQGGEPDRLEREGDEFHAAVRARLPRPRAASAGGSWSTATATVDDVGERVSTTPGRAAAGRMTSARGDPSSGHGSSARTGRWRSCSAPPSARCTRTSSSGRAGRASRRRRGASPPRWSRPTATTAPGISCCAGVHPDVVEIDPPATQIRIEDAQLIIDEVSRSPIEGERKVIVRVRRRAAPPQRGRRQQAAEDARGTAAPRR